MDNQIAQYYLAQAGGGIGQYYVGSPYQKGYGLGSWLGGLFRTIFPLLKSGAVAVGREAARAGSHVLADVAVGDSVKESARRHMGEAADNLAVRFKQKTSNMQGSGAIKRRKVMRPAHSVAKARAKQSDYLTA